MGVLAYLDPGTGAFVIQMLVAAVACIGFSIKLFWTHIKRFFCIITGKKTDISNSVDNSVSETDKHDETA